MYLSLSSLALVECQQTLGKEHELDARLAQSVLIRSVIQTAVGQTDRIHHWILTRTFVYFFNLFHPFKMCEEAKKRLDSLLLDDGFQTS